MFPSVQSRAERSTRDLIILSLGSAHPQSVSELHQYLRTEWQRRLSFQAVAKAVQKLHSDGIVERKGRQYQLHRSWINSLRAFGERVSQRYAAGAARPQFESRSGPHALAVYQAGSLYETDTRWTELLIESVSAEARLKKSPKLLSIGNVAWWLLLSIGRESGLFRDLLGDGVEVRMLLSAQYGLNRWASPIYREVGVAVKLFNEDRLPLSASYNVLNEHVIHVECEPQLVKPFSTLRYPFKAPELEQLQRWGHARGKCEITVSRNPVLAEALWATLGRPERKD